MPRKTHTGRFSVGDDPRSFESDGPALSLALTKALNGPDGCSFYVRELGTQGAIAVAEKIGGDVVIRRIR
jgi:hypothetical protein